MPIFPQDALFNVVLVEPEIHHNTGNIGRTCVGMNCHLHLVHPLGFSMDDKHLRRAGLDYWPQLLMTQHDNFAQWESARPTGARCYFFSTKAEKSFFDVEYQKGDFLVFGPETRGLSAPILEKYSSQLVKLPMVGPTRSLNLSNAVAAAVYEAFRQIRPC